MLNSDLVRIAQQRRRPPAAKESEGSILRDNCVKGKTLLPKVAKLFPLSDSKCWRFPDLNPHHSHFHLHSGPWSTYQWFPINVSYANLPTLSTWFEDPTTYLTAPYSTCNRQFKCITCPKQNFWTLSNIPKYTTILAQYPTYPLKMLKSSQLLQPKPRSHPWLFFFLYCTYPVHQHNLSALISHSPTHFSSWPLSPPLWKPPFSLSQLLSLFPLLYACYPKAKLSF